MIVPAVMFLEMAIDTLLAGHDRARIYPPLVDGGSRTSTRDREIKEFRMLGPARLEGLERALALHGDYTDAEVGYLLGLEVCRVLLSTMPAAVEAGVTL